MMKIYKYTLSLQSVQLIPMPEKARVLSAGLDGFGNLCLWAMFDEEFEERKMDRLVMVVGTGHEFMPYDSTRELTFVNSVQQDQFIWHIFT
jgi:hypothetical protein